MHSVFQSADGQCNSQEIPVIPTNIKISTTNTLTTTNNYKYHYFQFLFDRLFNQSIPFSALTLLVGRQKGIRPVKKLGVSFVGGDILTGTL